MVTVPADIAIPNPYRYTSASIFMNYDQSLPIVLYWLRERQGMSQYDLADRLLGKPLIGRSRDHISGRVRISKIESGYLVPKIETVETIAVALGSDMAKVMRMCEVLMKAD